MIHRAGVAGMLIAASLACAPAIASAQTQTIGINGGGFFLRGEDGRSGRDALNANLDFLDFDLRDFDGGTIGGEYAVGLGDFVEAGVGINFYQRTVSSRYADFTNNDGSDIFQDTRLRIIPVTAKVSYFPIGRQAPVQPYVGAGVNFYRWNYREEGDFIDFDTPGRPVINGRFEDDGVAVGPAVFGGVRGVIGSNYTIGGELRWQGGKADLDRSQGFAGDRLDLGGVALVGTFNIHF